MAGYRPIERAAVAGAEAAAARRLVMLLRAAALSGGRHDPEVFDAAVLSHRRAQRRAQLELQALGRARRTAGSAPEQRAA